MGSSFPFKEVTIWDNCEEHLEFERLGFKLQFPFPFLLAVGAWSSDLVSLALKFC